MKFLIVGVPVTRGDVTADIEFCSSWRLASRTMAVHGRRQEQGLVPRPAAPVPRPGRTRAEAGHAPLEGAEEDTAGLVGNLLPRLDVATLADVLGRTDGATRERVARDLQRSHGNAYVQRVVSLTPMQRAPAPAPATSTGTWLQPFPTTMPRMDVSAFPSAFDRIGSTLSGHPYIGSMPTASNEDLVGVERANSFFETSPLEPSESASGDYLQERNKLTDMFQRKAYYLTLYTLEQSERQAKSEQFRYAENGGRDNPEIGELKDAAAHLSEVQQALLRLANNPAMMDYTHFHPVASLFNLDDFMESPTFPSIAAPSALGDANTVDEESREAVAQFPAAAKKYKALREIYGQRFPVLLGANQDYYTLANASQGEIDKYAQAQSTEVEHNIEDARQELTPEKIWSLPIVIAQTKELLGIKEGTGANDAIEGKLFDIAWDSAFHKLAMAALQIGIQIVAAELTGGASLAVQAIGVGVTAVGVADEYADYKFQRAMSSRTALDSAQRLAAGDPGYGWLAFDIASMILDLGAAASAFHHMLEPLKAAEALGDTTKAVKAITAVESTSKATVSTMADVEEVVRAQARVLKQDGKLAEGMTEEIFVERIMSGLRREVATQGEIAEKQADVVANVLRGTHPQYQALLAKDRGALVGLLTEHGDWKSLVMALERGGQKEIAQNLLRERSLVIDEVAAEVRGLSKEPVPATVTPMKGSSTELVSDVDLQVSGGDAGQMMIESEGYMARRFGDNWSSMFRLNFYTEGNRLTRYQEVLSWLRPVEQVGMTKRITAQVERFTFAKMLTHAADDPVALARVESMAQRLAIDLDELRSLAAMDESARTAARNGLLQEIDALQAEYGTATGARRVELGEQISSKQIEANYYTHEANIGPGSLKLSGIRGLEMQESYQAALTQLEMIEHILAEAGGDVGRASREYELFKYVGRFGDVAETAGKDSAKLKYLRNQAKAVSGGQREMMEETAHEFLDADKLNRSGPTHADLPQETGATPPVTDDFLNKNFDMFEEEAGATLARLNPSAARRAPAPRVRNPSTTAPMAAVHDAEAAAEAAPRLVNHSTPERYYMVDAANKRFYAEGHIEDGGELSLTIRTQEGSARSEVLRGEDEFAAIMDHFGGNVTGVRGAWSYGSNLDKFNELTGAGKLAEEAALGTWTGRQAVNAGFTKVTIRSIEGTAGSYTKVNCLFHK